MKVTKYPQSCLVVEKDDGGRLLIDPGGPAVEAHSLADFGPLDAVLYTHRHADHLDERLLEPLREAGLRLIGNADVAGLIGEGAETVTDGQHLKVAGFDVVARDLPHVVMVDGAPGPPNTGFLLDGRFFHPGDGIRLDGLRVDTLAVPIAGPSISFRDAYLFVEQVGAARAVPIHYDVFIADPALFATRCDIADVVVLQPGESAQL